MNGHSWGGSGKMVDMGIPVGYALVGSIASIGYLLVAMNGDPHVAGIHPVPCPGVLVQCPGFGLAFLLYFPCTLSLCSSDPGPCLYFLGLGSPSDSG